MSAGVNFANWQVETLGSLLGAVLADDAECRARHVRAAMATEPEFALFASECGLDRDCGAQRLVQSLQEMLAPHTSPDAGDDAAISRLQSALLLRSRVELLQSDFAQALDDAKLVALAEFAAGAGHEMNNPLAVISGRAQLLLRGETDESRRADLALIKAQATRVHEMIADLMLFARPPAPQKREVDLAQLIRGVADTLRPAAEERGARIVLKSPDAPVPAMADPAQLGTVLRWLVENALNALGDGGEVTIDLEGTTIIIRDNGPGIAEAERGLIFDPYYSGRQAGRGLGMGLPKCWRLIQQHDGELSVRAATSGGTEFVIRLP